MALITRGSLHDFSVEPTKKVLLKKPFLKGINKFNTVREVERSIAPDSFVLLDSQEPRGVALKSIVLKEGFEGFLQNVWNKSNEVYFIAWAWDLSGQPTLQYPGLGTSPEDVIIKLKVGKLREFIGEGINLFPKRTVAGGIALRIQIWESDAGVRRFGEVLSETADTIQKSELNSLLSVISSLTGVTGATITLIEKASLELAKVIGTILKANSNDYVDFFEGYYAADSTWAIGEDKYDGNSSTISLNRY